MFSNSIAPSSWPREESLCKYEQKLTKGFSFHNPKSWYPEKKSSSRCSLPDSHGRTETKPSYLKSLIQRQSFRRSKNKENSLPIQIDDEELKVEINKASKYFYAAVKAFGIVSSRDIQKQMNMVIEEIWNERNESLDNLSKSIQRCYKKMEIWLKDMNEEVISENIGAFLDCIERYVMTIFHSHIYERLCKENINQDEAIYHKIYGLQWITPTHLGTNINEADKNVFSLVKKSVIDMISVDLKKNSLCKLRCIMECSKKIFAILKLHNIQGSADEFLPVMVYIVLKANPPRLYSNIKYMEMFSLGERISKLEEGYYFTNLCSARSYIEDITPQVLNLTEEEYRNHFAENSTSPKKDVTEKLFQIFTNAAELSVISQNQEHLKDRTCSLINEVKKLKESMSENNLRINALREERTIKSNSCVLKPEISPTSQDFTDPTIKYNTDLKITDKNPLKCLSRTLYLSTKPPLKDKDCSYLKSNIFDDCYIEKAVDALECLELCEKQPDVSFSI